jgi:hypothetical protein
MCLLPSQVPNLLCWFRHASSLLVPFILQVRSIRKNKNDIEIRKHFAAATAADKLDILLEVEETMPSEFKNLTRGARRWYERAKPMLICFDDCCKKDKATFLGEYKKKI